MRKSIKYLPKYAQDDLRDIKQRVLEGLPQCEMIILFGSYARGTFVSFDERDEFGIRTSFMSDYDLLVLTSHMDLREAGRILDNIDQAYYKRPLNQVPIQFINDDIRNFQEDVRMCRYFYTDIKKEGVMLYNSDKYTLPRCKKLDYQEISQEAAVYFKDKKTYADSFFEQAEFAFSRKDYRMASFLMHQTAENYFYAIRLVFTLKNSKQHNLLKLWNATRGYSEDLRSWFDMKDTEEKRLFELLKKAYVEARYNPNFLVTRKDCDFLLPKLQTLKEITKQICTQRLEWYGAEYLKKQKKSPDIPFFPDMVS